MLILKPGDLRYSEITPKPVYLNRRRFLAAVPAALVAARAARGAAARLPNVGKSQFSTSEPVTAENVVTRYNNFYEFGTGKSDPAHNAQNFKTENWTVSVEGECARPRKFSMDEILKLAPLEERIYRHRCVEAWSIVVPWIGYSFNVLAKQVDPKPTAKFVAFQTYYDIKQMPLGPRAGIEFPYVEGLRMDEAMNVLTLLTFGMYGETLPNQDGAPVRTVIPWKYGFKSIKSIVKIRFVKDMPPTTWNIANAHEYG